MSGQPPKRTDVEDLLKRVFPDDLPEDAARGLRRRVERFRSGRTAAAAGPSARARLFRPAAWAALSAAMLLAGILLQGAKASTPLADRITSLKSALGSLETTRR